MSWNHFPKLQPFLLMSLADSFKFQSNLRSDFNNMNLEDWKSPFQPFKKSKASKVYDASSNEDKFQQLLKKIQKVTQDYEDIYSISSKLNFSVKKEDALAFRPSSKLSPTQKFEKKSVRKARMMKFFEDTNEIDLNKNKIFAQNSPSKFTLTQNKNQNNFNVQPYKFYPKMFQKSASNTQSYSYLQDKQNFFNFQLTQTQFVSSNQSFQKTKKINIDLNILEKLPVTQSINFENLENFRGLQANEQQNNLFQLLSPKQKLKFSDFQLGNCIGSGKFGEVYVCRHKKTNFLCAMKKIMKATIEEYKMVDQFIRELKISYMVDHPNVIKTYGHFDDEFHVFLLMEYAGDGCVIDNLQFKKSEDLSSKVLSQTLNAINHLHQNNIIHRDLKPQNIVVFFKDTYKLCDFGLSAFANNEMKHTFCGTADYLSPEMKDVGEYDFSVDLWSLGVLAYELIVGEAPFKDKISEQKKKKGKKPSNWTWKVDYPREISELAKEFIQGLLKEKPQERVSIWSCLRHEFIKKYENKDMNIIKMAQNNA